MNADVPSMAHLTYGSSNNAAGNSLLVNNPEAKVEILGFKKDNEQSKYFNKDHVGYYIGMYGPQNQIMTKSDEAQFDKNSLILPKSYNLDDVKVGMFIQTMSKTRFSGRITKIDKNFNRILVSGWFKIGDDSAGQVPDAGSRVVMNAADKIWGQNTNVYISKSSTAKTATGYELGLISDGTHRNPVWGFHAANLSNMGSAFQQAFRATGNWNIGLYTSNKINTGVMVDEPKSYGFVINKLHDNAWKGAALLMNTANSNSFLLKSQDGDKTNFYIKSDGMKSNNIQEVLKVAKSTTLSINGPSIILCKNKKSIEIRLPLSNKRGLIYEIKSVYGSSVSIIYSDHLVTLDENSGTYVKMINDGDEWVLLHR